MKYSGGGALANVLWDFGDGLPATGASATHVYSTPGTYRVTALGWDTSGEAESWRLQRRWSGNNVMALGIVYESVARWLGHAVAVAAVGRIRDPVRRVPEGHVAADVPDSLALLVEFPGGVDATWTMTTNLAMPDGNTVRLIGTAGSLLVDLVGQRLELVPAGRTPEPISIPARCISLA